MKLDKPYDFIGRAALVEARKTAPKMRVVSLVAVDPAAPMAHGGEALLLDGKAVGEVTSAAFGAALDRVVMLAFLKTDGDKIDDTWLAGKKFEIDNAGRRIAVRASLKAPYDPAGLRVRG